MQLHSCRANIDIEPVIDYSACLEDTDKKTSKAEKMSSVTKNTFTSMVQTLQGTEDVKKVFWKIDFCAQEAIHHIVSFELVCSSFNVVNLSLKRFCNISIKDDNVETKPQLCYYAKRNTLETCCNCILQCNLVEFVANYFVTKHEIKPTQKEIIVRAFPNIYSDPKDSSYSFFCKYLLIKMSLKK